MTTTKVYGKIVFVCDECQDYLETVESTWAAAMKVFREERWLVERRSPTVFYHCCPECK